MQKLPSMWNSRYFCTQFFCSWLVNFNLFLFGFDLEEIIFVNHFAISFYFIRRFVSVLHSYFTSFHFQILAVGKSFISAFWGEKRERDLFFIVHIFPVFSVSDPVPFVRIRIGQKIRIQSGKSRSGSMRKTPKTCKNCTSIKNVIPVSYLALSTTPFFGQALL